MRNLRGTCWLVLAVIGCSSGAESPIDAPSLDARLREPAMTHTLYLNAEGVTLVPGEDDATTNRSAIPPQAVSLGAFLRDDSERQTKIDAIVMQLHAILAPYNIDIVTTRPATGSYQMIVMTDDPASALGLSATINATTRSSCNRRPSPISFTFGYAGATDQRKRDFAVRNVIAMFADQAAIPISRKPGDCMCFVDVACAALSPCTIGGPGTPIDSRSGCPTTETTMDEASLFRDVFGARE